MNSILIHPARRCAGVCVLALVAIMAFGASAQAADIELVVMGMVVGWARFAGMAARRWPVIRPHLSRESLEKRIAELGS